MTATPRTVRRATGAPPAPPKGGPTTPVKSSTKGLGWFKAHKPEAFLGLAGIGTAIYLYIKGKGSSSSSTPAATTGDGSLSPGVGGSWDYLGGGGPTTSTPGPVNPTKGTPRRGTPARPTRRRGALPVDPLTAAGRRRNTQLEANARRRNDQLNANATRRRDQLEANARRRRDQQEANARRPANRRSSNPSDALSSQFESQFGGPHIDGGPAHLGRT